MKLNTYKVYFTYKNGNINFLFSLRAINSFVAECRINRILSNAYLLKCFVDNVDTISIYENGVEICFIDYLSYIKKYDLNKI